MKQLVVIGGGAAGFFCAVNAARLHPGLKVALVEKSSKLLSKVKISGGGRCNVTHACFDIAQMSRHYPRGGHFVKKAFHQFFTTDTIKWFEERGVPLKTEKDGRMFPVSDSSQSIINCLLKEANRYKVDIMMNTEVLGFTKNSDQFELQLSGNRTLAADYLCVACGGYPKTSMFGWLQSSGHTIEEPVPSLFTFNLDRTGGAVSKHPITSLMGVSVTPARVRIRHSKEEQEGPLLITHWGFSGPAILKLSAWAARDLKARNWIFGININWLPAYNEKTLREQFRQLRIDKAALKLGAKNPFGLPNRLWDYFLEAVGIKPETRWADLPATVQNKLILILCNSEYDIKGKTTFKEEFVTAGGIKLSEVDPNTMMSKKIPGLFFAGEILDVDGVTGGFNFQHAWTSGFIAATGMHYYFT